MSDSLLIHDQLAVTKFFLPSSSHALIAQVVVNRVSVNFDEQQFTNSEHFDIGRDPNHHQTFGHGIHFCLGAPLARLEAKIALNMLLERMPEAHIVHDQSLHQIESSLFFGPRHLPLAF